eukprot:1299202-Alexandrium_andersonii.AAC.1
MRGCCRPPEPRFSLGGGFCLLEPPSWRLRCAGGTSWGVPGDGNPPSLDHKGPAVEAKSGRSHLRVPGDPQNPKNKTTTAEAHWQRLWQRSWGSPLALPLLTGGANAPRPPLQKMNRLRRVHVPEVVFLGGGPGGGGSPPGEGGGG